MVSTELRLTKTQSSDRAKTETRKNKTRVSRHRHCFIDGLWLDKQSCIKKRCVSRSATGEAWQEVMMAVSNHPLAACDPLSDDAGKRCGSSFAFPYFIAFYVLCSFLVSSTFAIITTESTRWSAYLRRAFSCFILGFLFFYRNRNSE